MDGGASEQRYMDVACERSRTNTLYFGISVRTAWRTAPPAGELSVGVRILIKNPQIYLDNQNKLYYSHIVIKTLKFKILENQTKEKRKWKN